MTNLEAEHKPLVSVWMIAYNHEKFISEAIEGVLMQKTTFPIELIIGEDGSTDKTALIIKEYVKKYPDLIKARYNMPNIGMMPNMVKTLQECSAKYIALCEGDDYWTDSNKLQRQVNFLEANTDFSICYHNISILEGNQLTDSHVPVYNKDFLTIVDLAKENCIHTPTCVFRNNLFDQFPEFFNSCPAGDYALHLLNAQYGKIKYLPEKMAVYRRHPGGVWAGRELTSKLNAWLDVLTPLINYFKESPEVKSNLTLQRKETLMRLIKTAATEGDKDVMFKVLQKTEQSELHDLAKYIIDINNNLNKSKKNATDMNFIIEQISLKTALILLLKKCYYSIINYLR
ncbi:MAG: glycosyltransferase [Methyloprofundus sp.]|nr:glycosyltransferase [Methyloprofundus sp.]